MKLTVNGRPHEHRGDGSVGAILVEIGADRDKIAAMVNEKIVASAEFDETHVVEGDTLEILSLMGGG